MMEFILGMVVGTFLTTFMFAMINANERDDEDDR